MPKSITDNLNEQQKNAVCAPQKPLLILAGAGTGKTRVLTRRIAYLISLGTFPGSVLAVTFTNKAANEMKERVMELIGSSASMCWIGTFHSISARILRREYSYLGYKSNFTIYDSDDQRKLLKRIMKRLEISEKQTPVSLIHNKISNAKNQLIAPNEYKNFADELLSDKIVSIYEEYQKELKSANAMDFDDLIMKTVELFNNEPQLRESYQDRFKNILVDEYQDTNMAQFNWVRLLSEKHKNITVVGDDDQSIYGWRGADVQNILSFEENFTNADIYRLEENYRSTPQILHAANSLIANNKGRKGKTLWTSKKEGEKLDVYLTEDEVSEADSISNEILSKREIPYSSFSVLYRTNAQSRALEDSLRTKGIPYIIIGGTRFYERREIKDILAYLFVSVNPFDDQRLLRIINVPKRGIGLRTLQLLGDYASSTGISLFEALGRIGEIDTISQSASKRLYDFGNKLKRFVDAVGKISPVEFIEKIIEDTGYIEDLLLQKNEDAEDRVNNVKELVRAVELYCLRVENPDLNGFLEEVSLISDIDSWDKSKDAVSLMTVHSAKGLEFPYVYITGMEQGLFPVVRSLDSEESLEEERRLFYVAITRAQKKVNIFYAKNRRRYGYESTSFRSIFLDEIDNDVVVRHDLLDKPVYTADSYSNKTKTEESPMPNYEDFSQENKTLKVGAYVEHVKLGKGRVLSISGFGQDVKITVDFNGVQKKLLARYANLKIV